MTGSEPKVCVGVSTFNQARFLRQALDSVLAQETSFELEVVVHDDASTDGTREIVAAYAAAHPGRVRAVLQDENQYSRGRRVILLLLAAMRGEYFALLDGDDFWTARHKLQAQADFLDANPGCALVQPQTVYFNETLQRVVRLHPYPERRRSRLTCAALAAGNFVQTSAVMFRRSALPAFPPEIHALKLGDYPIFAMLAQSGWIGYLDEPMVTYRLHGTNMWMTRSSRARREAMREVLEFLATHLTAEQRGPWIAAARRPSWRSPSAAVIRGLAKWHDLTDRVRFALGRPPR